MTRDEINHVLDLLPAIYWPVFFVELIWFRLFQRDFWCETGGLYTFTVTKRGRIVITGLFTNEAPDETDWTRHAPREPWAALDPEVIAAALDAVRQPDWKWTVSGLRLDCPRTGFPRFRLAPQMPRIHRLRRSPPEPAAAGAGLAIASLLRHLLG